MNLTRSRWSAAAAALVPLLAITAGPLFPSGVARAAGTAIPPGGAPTFTSLASFGADTVGPRSVVKGPDGNVWFTTYVPQPYGGSLGSVGRVTPSGAVKTWPLETGARGIVVGPDRALWFAEDDGQIGRITTAGKYHAFPSHVDVPFGITVGPDHQLWYTGASLPTSVTTTGYPAIARMNVKGKVTLHAQLNAYDNPGQIVSTDGALWYANSGSTDPNSPEGPQIDRFTTNGKVKRFRNKHLTFGLSGLTVGPDHALWAASGDIVRMTTAGKFLAYKSAHLDAEGFGGLGFDIAVGPDKALWFGNSPGGIGEITTAGKLTFVKGSVTDDIAGLATGPHRTLWFASGNHTIAKLTIGHKIKISKYGGRAVDGPYGITAGPDKALWITNSGNNTIGRISPTVGATRYSGKGIRDPHGIVTGPDKALWFTNFNGKSIGRISPTTHKVRIYTGPRIDKPQGIAASATALWFTNYADNSIGRITTAGKVTNYTGTGISHPNQITLGPDGAMWFTNSGNNSIGRIDTSTGAVTNFTSPSMDHPVGITSAGGQLWFTSSTIGPDSSIERISTSGAVARHVTPSQANIDGIAAGRYGQIWYVADGFSGNNGTDPGGFGVRGTDADYRFRTNNTNSVFGPIAAGSVSITLGPDGAMWFTNDDSDTVSRVTATH